MSEYVSLKCIWVIMGLQAYPGGPLIKESGKNLKKLMFSAQLDPEMNLKYPE